MMAGSDLMSSDAGLSAPADACTIAMESSTVTLCRPVSWMSSSVRPRHGRMMLCFASSRCERLGFVAICTARSSLRMAANVASGSDIATARLPPRQISAFDLPSSMAAMASTALWPFSRGAVMPNVRSRLSSSSFDGISVMPTVRSPCTLEWPRSGQMPAPSLPRLPRSKSRLAIWCTLDVPCRCCVTPMP